MSAYAFERDDDQEEARNARDDLELGTESGLSVSAACKKRACGFRRLPTSPSQTITEVNCKVSAGGLTDEEINDLWDSVFLTLLEIEEFLAHDRTTALHECLYPMFVFAAHIGARRSEVRRSRIDDLDFNNKRVFLREKKRVRGRHTLRSVPMSPTLERALREWLKIHPGGRFTFRLGQNVLKSSKDRIRQPAIGPIDEAGSHTARVWRESIASLGDDLHSLRAFANGGIVELHEESGVVETRGRDKVGSLLLPSGRRIVLTTKIPGVSLLEWLAYLGDFPDLKAWMRQRAIEAGDQFHKCLCELFLDELDIVTRVHLRKGLASQPSRFGRDNSTQPIRHNPQTART